MTAKFSNTKPMKSLNETINHLKKIYRKIEASKPKKYNICCPFCLKKTATLQFKYITAKYLKCSSCKSIYLSPTIDKSTLKKYFKLSSESSLINLIPMKTLKTRRKNLMLPRLKFYKKELQKIKFKLPVKEYLEIGPGVGYFTELAFSKKISKNYTLIEPDQNCNQILKSLNPNFKIINKNFEEIKSNQIKKKFDLIFINSVIEHPHSIEKFFNKIKLLLSNNGLVCLTDMNASGIDNQILLEKTPNINPYSILQIASKEGLEILLSRFNLKILKVFSSGKFDMDMVYEFAKESDKNSHLKKYATILGSEKLRAELQKVFAKYYMTGYNSYIISHKNNTINK